MSDIRDSQTVNRNLERRGEESFSGQQLAQLRASASQAIQHAVEKMALRQKCLELAVQACGNNPDKIVAIAGAMYDFVSAPAGDLSMRLDPPSPGIRPYDI